MSTPCDGVPECINDSDESNCGFPSWLLPNVLLTSVIILLWSCFFSLRNDIKKFIKIIKWRLEGQKSTQIDPSKKSSRHLGIAYSTEIGNVDDIRNLFIKEIGYHGSEGDAICCLKV